MDPRTAQAGSPIALALFDLLADPSSALYGLLRVSDLFCVRLTCKEAWRCIQHRPLTKNGVLRAAADSQGFDHHVPLLRWCLRNGIVGFCSDRWYLETFGEAGDPEIVSELLKFEPKTKVVMKRVLSGIARAGHDEFALQQLSDYAELYDEFPNGISIYHDVAAGGCVLAAAALDHPTAWVEFLSHALRRGHQRFVEWVLADVEPNADVQYVADAAKSGSLELVKWLYAKGYKVGGGTLTNAAGSGNVGLCKWVSDHGLDPTQGAMEVAVEGDHVEVLEWLSTFGCTCTSELLRHAVRTAGVPVVSWCLDRHPHPPDAGDLLALSCTNLQGANVFEYFVDQCGFQSSPPELMQAVAENDVELFEGGFDAAILAKRYGTPLFPGYLVGAVHREDVGFIRFALSQGLQVSGYCFEVLIEHPDATLLNEVLLAMKVGGAISEADRTLIARALSRVKCHPSAKKVLVDHSIVV